MVTGGYGYEKICSPYSQCSIGAVRLFQQCAGICSRLIREKCDFVASIPMKGDIDSLNASVAAGVLGYEIVRQRLQKK